MSKKREQKEITVTVIYSEGWQDRVAKALAELYYNLESKKEKKLREAG